MTRVAIGPAIVFALATACYLEPRSYSPNADEVKLRATGPGDIRPRVALDPTCTAALAKVDAAIASFRLDDAEAMLDTDVCDDGAGIDWRRGLVAKARGDYDTAVNAFVAELRGPAPIPFAGAHLLEALPHASDRARRFTARHGRRFDSSGLDGLPNERMAMAECGGRPVTMLKVSCNRDPPRCDYLYRCEGGGRRHIVVSSAELWFDLR